MKEAKSCKNCKNLFIHKGRNSGQVYCKPECYSIWRKMHPNKGTFKKGHVISEKHRLTLVGLAKKRPPYWKDKKFSVAHRLNISTKHKLLVSNGSNKFWKGGITSINEKIRGSFEYRLWRESVFKRDNYTCVWCGIKGYKLNADHIKPFCMFPELRFAIDNGRTLCVPCHKKTDTYGHNIKKYVINK